MQKRFENLREGGLIELRASHPELRPDTTFVQEDIQVQTVEKGASPLIEVVSTGRQRFSVRGHDRRPEVGV